LPGGGVGGVGGGNSETGSVGGRPVSEVMGSLLQAAVQQQPVVVVVVVAAATTTINGSGWAGRVGVGGSE
jgi:hypothetical protein